MTAGRPTRTATPASAETDDDAAQDPAQPNAVDAANGDPSDPRGAPPAPEPPGRPALDRRPAGNGPGQRDRRSRSHAAGPLPRLGHRRPRFRLAAAEAERADPVDRRAVAAGHRRPGEDRRARLIEALGHFGVEATVVGTVAGPHITRYELRLAPGIKVAQGRPAQGRPRLRAGGDRHPHPRADPRQAGRRRRGPQRAPADRPPRRRLPGAAGRLVAADRLARQGHRRPGDRRRPGEDAAPARRRHDRRRQVGLRSTRCCRRSCCGHAARGPARPRRPQAGRAQPLRVDPAPADAGHHEPEGWPPTRSQNLVREMEQRYGIMSLARTRSLPELNKRARASAASRRCRTSSA